jgi:hypothetical protein
VLRQVTSRGKAIDGSGSWGDDYVAWSWAFVLQLVDATTTRLLIRIRTGYRPASKWAPYMWLLVEPAHFVMGRRQLLGLRERVEATGREASLAGPVSDEADGTGVRAPAARQEVR